MKFFYRIAPIVLLFSTIFFVSCKNDDGTCVATDASENIIGSWSLHTGGEVEFEKGGTLLDPNTNLIGAGVNNVVYDQKSYEVIGDSLALHASPPDFSDTVTHKYGLAKNLCDTIWISQGPFAIVMTRIE